MTKAPLHAKVMGSPHAVRAFLAAVKAGRVDRDPNGRVWERLARFNPGNGRHKKRVGAALLTAADGLFVVDAAGLYSLTEAGEARLAETEER